MTAVCAQWNLPEPKVTLHKALVRLSVQAAALGVAVFAVVLAALLLVVGPMMPDGGLWSYVLAVPSVIAGVIVAYLYHRSRDGVRYEDASDAVRRAMWLCDQGWALDQVLDFISSSDTEGDTFENWPPVPRADRTGHVMSDGAFGGFASGGDGDGGGDGGGGGGDG